MDHIKDVRNFYHDLQAARSAEIDNPLCGDTMTVYVRVGDDDTVQSASFHCECCGIAMASASIMTQAIRGMKKQHAIDCAKQFAAAIDAGADERVPGIDDAHVAVLLAVSASPSRKMCAKLSWLGLCRALETPTNTDNTRANVDPIV